MKKCGWTHVGVLLAVVLLLSIGGCGQIKTDEVQTTTVVADRTGKLEQIIVEPLGDETYTAEELETYVVNTISAYTGEEETRHIQLESCSIEENTVRLRISYESWSDYAGYNQVACFFGTLKEAEEAGYSFERSFLDNSGKAAAGATILAHGEEWKLLILEEPLQVQVPGTILYVTDNVSLTEAADTAMISARAASGSAEQFVATTEETAYIIFR